MYPNAIRNSDIPPIMLFPRRFIFDTGIGGNMKQNEVFETCVFAFKLLRVRHFFAGLFKIANCGKQKVFSVF